MLEYIAHRINSIEALKKVPKEYGVELDLRDNNDGSIRISHDPFVSGDSFEDYLRNYEHGTMILNIKSERIEPRILELLKKYQIEKYFFLDSSFPMIHLLSKQGEKNIALRISEYEGTHTARMMSGRVNWIWVDSFDRIPIGIKEFEELKELGYKICIVSPELQGRDKDIENYKEQLFDMGVKIDAVCTKLHNIDRWE